MTYTEESENPAAIHVLSLLSSVCASLSPLCEDTPKRLRGTGKDTRGDRGPQLFNTHHMNKPSPSLLCANACLLAGLHAAKGVRVSNVCFCRLMLRQHIRAELTERGAVSDHQCLSQLSHFNPLSPALLTPSLLHSHPELRSTGRCAGWSSI